jgi:hypothetical protein
MAAGIGAGLAAMVKIRRLIETARVASVGIRPKRFN